VWVAKEEPSAVDPGGRAMEVHAKAPIAVTAIISATVLATNIALKLLCINTYLLVLVWEHYAQEECDT